MGAPMPRASDRLFARVTSPAERCERGSPIDAGRHASVTSIVVGKSLVFLVLLAACSFDSQTDSVGGASLGDGDDSTGGVSGSPTTASTASGTTAPSTTMPATSGTSAMTSESETDPVGETGTPTTSPTSTSAESTASESDTQPSDSMTSDGTMMATTEMATTATTEENYPDCLDGDCPEGHQCRHYSTDSDPLAFSICTPL